MCALQETGDSLNETAHSLYWHETAHSLYWHEAANSLHETAHSLHASEVIRLCPGIAILIEVVRLFPTEILDKKFGGQ